MKRRCPQCWQMRNYPSEFIGAKGKTIRWCTTCRTNYRGWDKKSVEECVAVPRTGVPKTPSLRARLAMHSGAKKLGGIPASMTSRGTCPTSCSFYDAGCYALYHVTAFHWRRVGRQGDSWETFLDDVRRIPEGQLWRHNIAGDLPGEDEKIDALLLARLVSANAGRRGFTFTHKPMLGRKQLTNRVAVNSANRNGFTINLSANSLAQADALARLKIAPVAVVLPSDAPIRTPAGRRVVVCPAERIGITCAECELCQNVGRHSIVGFKAHGQASNLISNIVRKPKALADLR